MTEGPSAPRPADWTTAEQTKHKYVYDAWNRLVKVTDNSNATIALYRYDGLGRRIARLLPNGETWDRTDYYYAESWQVLEERFAGGVSDANKDTQTTVDNAGTAGPRNRVGISTLFAGGQIVLCRAPCSERAGPHYRFRRDFSRSARDWRMAFVALSYPKTARARC